MTNKPQFIHLYISSHNCCLLVIMESWFPTDHFRNSQETTLNNTSCENHHLWHPHRFWYPSLSFAMFFQTETCLSQKIIEEFILYYFRSNFYFLFIIRRTIYYFVLELFFWNVPQGTTTRCQCFILWPEGAHISNVLPASIGDVITVNKHSR